MCSTTAVSCEQYSAATIGKPNFYMGDISEAVWRSEFYSPTTGVITLLLPEIGRLAGDAKDRGPSECCIAAALCYGVPVWAANINQQVVDEVWDAQRAFGMVDAKFVPYWKQQRIVCSDPQIRLSFWQKGERCLLAVTNFTGQPRTVELRRPRQLQRRSSRRHGTRKTSPLRTARLG